MHFGGGVARCALVLLAGAGAAELGLGKPIRRCCAGGGGTTNPLAVRNSSGWVPSPARARASDVGAYDSKAELEALKQTCRRHGCEACGLRASTQLSSASSGLAGGSHLPALDVASGAAHPTHVAPGSQALVALGIQTLVVVLSETRAGHLTWDRCAYIAGRFHIRLEPEERARGAPARVSPACIPPVVAPRPL